MQKTDFPTEILIYDDASTDKTSNIIRDYESRYPNLIKPLYQIQNQHSQGKKPNLEFNFPRAKGKYIAMCEGDDYWTDPYKLQKQVDFLESHTDFSICYHNVLVIYENDPGQSHPFYANPTRDSSAQRHPPKPISTIEDLIRGNFIQTPSVVFRAHLFEGFPDWFYKMDRGDWPLYVLNAQYGLLGYLDEIMACYRIHTYGIYSSMSQVARLQGALHVAKTLDKHFNYKYHNIISTTNDRRLSMILNLLLTEGKYLQAFLSWWKYLFRCGMVEKKVIPSFIKNSLLNVMLKKKKTVSL
jgi:glycosyltransferase involved in cell wall biosynthesis